EDYGMKNFALLLAITLMLLVVACQKVEAPVPTEKDGEQVWHNLLTRRSRNQTGNALRCRNGRRVVDQTAQRPDRGRSFLLRPDDHSGHGTGLGYASGMT